MMQIRCTEQRRFAKIDTKDTYCNQESQTGLSVKRSPEEALPKAQNIYNADIVDELGGYRAA